MKSPNTRYFNNNFIDLKCHNANINKSPLLLEEIKEKLESQQKISLNAEFNFQDSDYKEESVSLIGKIKKPNLKFFNLKSINDLKDTRNRKGSYIYCSKNNVKSLSPRTYSNFNTNHKKLNSKMDKFFSRNFTIKNNLGNKENLGMRNSLNRIQHISKFGHNFFQPRTAKNNNYYKTELKTDNFNSPNIFGLNILKNIRSLNSSPAMYSTSTQISVSKNSSNIIFCSNSKKVSNKTKLRTKGNYSTIKNLLQKNNTSLKKSYKKYSFYIDSKTKLDEGYNKIKKYRYHSHSSNKYKNYNSLSKNPSSHLRLSVNISLEKMDLNRTNLNNFTNNHLIKNKINDNSSNIKSYSSLHLNLLTDSSNKICSENRKNLRYKNILQDQNSVFTKGHRISNKSDKYYSNKNEFSNSKKPLLTSSKSDLFKSPIQYNQNKKLLENSIHKMNLERSTNSSELNYIRFLDKSMRLKNNFIYSNSNLKKRGKQINISSSSSNLSNLPNNNSKNSSNSILIFPKGTNERIKSSKLNNFTFGKSNTSKLNLNEITNNLIDKLKSSSLFESFKGHNPAYYSLNTADNEEKNEKNLNDKFEFMTKNFNSEILKKVKKKNNIDSNLNNNIPEKFRENLINSDNNLLLENLQKTIEKKLNFSNHDYFREKSITSSNLIPFELLNENKFSDGSINVDNCRNFAANCVNKKRFLKDNFYDLIHEKIKSNEIQDGELNTQEDFEHGYIRNKNYINYKLTYLNSDSNKNEKRSMFKSQSSDKGSDQIHFIKNRYKNIIDDFMNAPRSQN